MAQRRNEKPAKRKECYFSKNKIEYVDYKDCLLYTSDAADE